MQRSARSNLQMDSVSRRAPADRIVRPAACDVAGRILGEGVVREVDRLADQLTQTYAGDSTGAAWYGPALRPLLRGVSPAAAARRPLPRRHTIWELALHLAANVDFVLARLDGRELELSLEADWPPAPEPTAATAEAW